MVEERGTSVSKPPGAFPHLLAPGRIGSLELRNRLVMSPMETMYGTSDGLPSERTVAYFEARAAGGVGLITVGATGIDHLQPETPGGLHLGTDESVGAHRRLVDAVHAHGAKIQPQIVHAGPDGLGPELHGVASLGPSAIASYLTGRPSEPITSAQWSQVLDLYRRAVVRAREAGYDGIELHAAHGYMMLGSFLAPQRNRRTDGYRGSSVRGRIRAVVEALEAIRSEVGPDFPITLRISGYERVAGGRPSYETAQVAPLLVAAGVDAFHVSGGVIDRLVSNMVNSSDFPDGLNVGAAAAVREVVDVPVIAVGRLHDPQLAERVLAAGRADFVAMGRPLLADPDLPRKLATGDVRRVRPCISCENCIDSMEIRFSVDCAVNPRTGRELELVATPTTAPRHVVVVGAGPAGLEAARVSCERGHRVTLVDRANHLGGELVRAAQAHHDNAPALDWLTREVDMSPIEVRLGFEADTGSIAALGPDVVVVATGGRVAYPPIPGADLPHVVTRYDVLDGIALGDRVAVIGASLTGLELAEVLARRPRLVSVLTPLTEVAPEFGWKRKTEHLDRLDRLGVTIHTEVSLEKIVAEGVRFLPTAGTSRLLPVDHVVLVGEVEPDLSLRRALEEAHPDLELHVAGDASGLALVQGATLGGAQAGCAV